MSPVFTPSLVEELFPSYYYYRYQYTYSLIGFIKNIVKCAKNAENGMFFDILKKSIIYEVHSGK